MSGRRSSPVSPPHTRRAYTSQYDAYEKQVTALNTRRIVAAIIDLWLIPLIGAVAVQYSVAREATEWSPAALWTGAVLVALVPLAMEATTGRTIGKAVRRIKVVRADREPASVSQRALRRSWTLAFLVQPLLPGWYGIVLLLLVAAVVATMLRDEETRGFPDTLAGTSVVPDGKWILRVGQA